VPRMKRCTPLAFLLVVALVGACSSSAKTPASTTPPAPATSTTTARSTTTQPGSESTGCTHSPIAHVENSYYGLPAPNGTSIDFIATSFTSDGHGDTVRAAGLSVEMTGTRGTITLTTPAAGSSVVLRGAGDFNGDNRGDLLVDVTDGTHYATYIVLGTVGPGTHDPAAVGERVPSPDIAAGGFAAFPAPVGDQNGDGVDDVSFGTQLYSGRVLTSLPTAPTLPTPFRTLSAPYVGLLQLAPKTPPVFVVPARSGSSLRVLDKRSDRLLLGGVATVGNESRATGWLVNGHHIVELSSSTRGGETAWRWDLDGACGS
jgi:hypothetical protein